MTNVVKFNSLILSKCNVQFLLQLLSQLYRGELEDLLNSQGYHTSSWKGNDYDELISKCFFVS